MCRYQARHFRTSYWSSPTAPFASAKPSSIAHRRPATRASSSSRVPAGPTARKYATSAGSLRLRRASSHRAVPGASS